MGIVYRLRQFWRLLKIQPFPEEGHAAVSAVLTPGELDLFRRQATADQTHALRVLKTLQEAGETDRDLLAAALLHDAGKCHLSPTVWDRVVGAAGEKLFAKQAAKWGTGAPTLLRRPFVIRFQHAAWGAEMAQEAGSRARAVRLIRHHQDDVTVLADPGERRLLTRLKWADDQN